MLMTILLVVAAALAALLIWAATRADHFRVERSTRVAAPPGVVFAHIEDFRCWADWSPWAKKDPAMKSILSGAERGEGAVYEWQGNNAVGRGRMQIVQAAAPTRIDIKLDFIKPFEAHNSAEFDLRGDGDHTLVTWAVHGPSPFLSRLMGVFFDMDRMIGADFEAGLANLKAVVEAQADGKQG